MATFTAIQCKKQSTSSMRGVIDYVEQEEKTRWGDAWLVTGSDCVPQSAFIEMQMTPKNRKEPAGKFSFVDLENVNAPPEARHQGETLALFLERPYNSGLSPEKQLQVNALLVKLAQQKAAALGAMLVLSLDYREIVKDGFAQTCLHLYISASKAGGQYLDSLGGKAEVSSEGSYKKNTFLLDRSKGLTEKADETVCA